MKKLLMYVSVLLIVFVINVISDEIHDAAEAGDLEKVKQILKENSALLDEQNDRGSTPLLSAVSGGQMEVTEFLLSQGANTEAVNNRGSTALHLAAYFGHKSLVDYLVEKKFDVNARSNSGFTPLMFATYRGYIEVVKILNAAGNDLNISDNDYGGAAFHWACSRGPVEMAEYLLSLGCDINGYSTTDSSTPVFWSTYARNLETLQFLINKGADINIKMPDGWTALHNSARNGHVEGARILIEHGADIEAINENGWTPLFAASEGGHLEMVTFLLDKGANRNVIDSNGFTALHIATFSENLELVEHLMTKGMDVSVQNENGSTLLHAAARRGNIEMARLFILGGAKVDIANNDGETPLGIAIIQGYDEIIELLLNKGVNPSRADERYERTPLHWAAIKGNTLAANYLLNNGSEVNAEDNVGKTPIYYAAKFGYKDLFELLKSEGGIGDDPIKNFGNSPLLQKKLSECEAYLWYLGHCGWAFKTKNHLLIFDYWNQGKNPAEPLLANGHINPAEIVDQNVSVFVTHEHGDHFDTSIFAWPETVENINYIFGCRPEEMPQFRDSGYTGPGYTYIGPRQNKTIDGMDIHTLEANDGGVGFLVTVDGITIYHAGDHAGWREGEREGFTREIDYLAELGKPVDFAILNVTGCHVQDTITLAESVCYTLEKLRPRMWIPTHGLNREYVYRNFADKIAAEGFTTKALCAKYRGDRFFCLKGRI